MRKLIRLLARLGRGPGILIDYLKPKPEAVQILLIRRGQAEAGIYLDETGEIRSPSLQTPGNPDAATPTRNC